MILRGVTLLLALLLAACGPASPIIVGGPDSGSDPDDSTGIVDSSPFFLPGDSAADDSGDTDTDPGGSEDDEAIFQAFFDVSVIQEIDIALSGDAIRQINSGATDAYVEADITVNGAFFPQSGLRLKGSSTYQDLDCRDGYCKAAFKIKLDEFVLDQKLGDLERITLNNMTSDYTQSKELIAYDLLNQHSQLASRCNFARVTLNGEPWGLYANVESADDEWLKRRFTDPEGSLWGTGSSYGDFYAGYLDTGWVLKSGVEGIAPLQAVTAALDAFTGDFFGELGALLNTDQWLDYWAWCAATGNYDGYPFHLNDVLIYADPADAGRFVFAPWGTDETWDEYEYTGQTWNTVGGRLGYACLADPACVAELKVRIGVAVTEYEASDVLGVAEAAWALSEADVLTDPVRPFTPSYVWAYRDYYAELMPRYGAYVRGKVGI